METQTSSESPVVTRRRNGEWDIRSYWTPEWRGLSYAIGLTSDEPFDYNDFLINVWTPDFKQDFVEAFSHSTAVTMIKDVALRFKHFDTLKLVKIYNTTGNGWYTTCASLEYMPFNYKLVDGVPVFDSGPYDILACDDVDYMREYRDPKMEF